MVQDAVSSTHEFPKGRATSPDASGTLPVSVPSEVCHGLQKHSYAMSLDYIQAASHPPLNTTSLCETDPQDWSIHRESSRDQHFCRKVFVKATKPYCKSSGGCTSSTPVNKTHHRPHGERPSPNQGSQDIERDRLFGGLPSIECKKTMCHRNNDLNTPAPDDQSSHEQFTKLTGLWGNCATIQPSNFPFKSLSNWSFNIAVGCKHGCGFCYVPGTSTIKLSPQLTKLGVDDPDTQWGDYVYLREWDKEQFLRSLQLAENTPVGELNPDGNRAVLYCSTMDPYQVLPHPDPEMRRKLADHASHLVRRSLELIRDESTLNVRILTHSPLASRDFDLFQSFGNRLVFGMSLPTLNNDLAKVYEPHAPAPSQRLKTLQEAKEAGLHVFVAMAPTYPSWEGQDLRNTLTAIRELDPITVFHEPINIQAENVWRIKKHARSLEVTVKTDVFRNRESRADYALHSMYLVEIIAEELGMTDCLHLWPDKSLGSKWMLKRFSEPQEQLDWLNHWWNRISEWPSKD